MNIRKTTLYITSFIFLVLPFTTQAQGLLPDCDADCNFHHFIQLVQNVINFLIYASVPLAAIAFAIAGAMMLTAGGDTGKIKAAREIIINTAIGFIIVLSAWLVVHFITSALLDSDIKTFLGFMY